MAPLPLPLFSHQVIGSGAVGMFTMRKRSLSAQLKNGLTFAGFNFLLMGFAGDTKKGDQPTVPAGKKGKGGAGGKRKDDAEMEISRGRSMLRDPPKRSRG